MPTSAKRFSHSRRRTVIAVAIAALFGGVTAADAADSTSREAAAWCASRCDELVIDWNATAYQVIKAEENYANPMSASRSGAMMHLAMHDAVNAPAELSAYAYAERDRAAHPRGGGRRCAPCARSLFRAVSVLEEGARHIARDARTAAEPRAVSPRPSRRRGCTQAARRRWKRCQRAVPAREQAGRIPVHSGFRFARLGSGAALHLSR